MTDLILLLPLAKSDIEGLFGILRILIGIGKESSDPWKTLIMIIVLLGMGYGAWVGISRWMDGEES